MSIADQNRIRALEAEVEKLRNELVLLADRLGKLEARKK